VEKNLQILMKLKFMQKIAKLHKHRRRDIFMRNKIIRIVQKKADTSRQKIDASIVSRVASLTIDEVIKLLRRKRNK